MASLGKLVLVAGLAMFLAVLAAQDHANHGLVIGAAAAPAPPVVIINGQAVAVQPLPEESIRQQLLSALPPSGPSDKSNGKVEREKPASGRADGWRLVGSSP
ncbi:hypothetical protein BS78_10G272800 [Paspalum vaginatum]|nr:hypothetical protein BS78_10G272800 [Paspalum vaginatum]